jgi:hypothetical protein
MILDGETTKTKVVDLEKLFNFIADNFFIWNYISQENYVWIFSQLKFKFFMRPCMEKPQKMKVVNLENL